MKRISLLIFTSLIIALSGASVAYLGKPTNISINLNAINAVREVKADLFIKSSWGNSANKFGIQRSDWVPGPMSLTNDAKNNLYLLDQVNKRVKRFDKSGKQTRIIGIDDSNYEDLAIDNKGFVYLLDGAGEHIVKKFDQEGKIIRVYRIAKAIQPISGLYINDSQVYVEVEHDKLYKIGSTLRSKSGAGQLKSEASGRPEDDYKTEAELNEQGELSAQIRGRHPLDSISVTGEMIYSIISIDSDKDENLVLVFNIAKNEKLFDQGKDRLQGLVISPAGELKFKFFAENDYYTSHFRKVTVSPDGSIYQMQTTSEGVVVWRWQ